MRLNAEKYKAILTEKQISDADVRRLTGLSEKTYFWILDNGFIELETLERIADAVGCYTGDIYLPDYGDFQENGIEWIKNAKRATVSLSQRRTISRVKKLAARYPDQCQIVAENKDGSICAHIPVSWVRINPEMKLTDEQRKQRADTLRKNVLNND